MSQSREDYIKFIYEHDSKEPVTNKQIAQGLKVSPASVSEMIHKLSQEGLIEYIPYQGGILTHSGRQMGEDLVRKHEIWEYFLYHKLGYSMEEVHDLAEVLEHATSTELANRLAKFIDFQERE